jgi:nucleoside 2-deoxyribosyltransferase
LADITAISDNARGVVVKPIFGRVVGDYKPAQVFVLMPFNAELSELHTQHFKRLAKQLGVTIKRADELYSLNESFMTKVWRAISFADLIIADCTQKNPNVFYEIGMAHVLGKPVVFITRSDDDIPSDIKHLDYIAYKYDSEGVDSLLAKLERIIREKLNLPSP